MSVAPFISAISLAVLIFLSVLLLIERQRARGTVYLLVLLVLLASYIATRLAFDLQSPLLIYLPFVVFPAAFFYAPCIYLYTEAVLFNRKKPAVFWVGLITVPALTFATHLVLQFRYPEMSDVGGILTQAGIIAPYTRILLLAGLCYNLAFVISSALNLRAYSASYQENFAGNDREQVNWLKLLVVLNLILLGSFFAVALVIIFFDWKIPQTPVEGIIALIMIYIILYYFVKKPVIFTLPALPEGEKKDKNTKYQKQNLSAAERLAYLAKIEEYLKEEKPFLDDKVTLAALARELKIPAHHFSMVINIERGMNFYHFINAYRVEEAKALLKREDMRDETVLDIGLMAGFQSKAGFNKVFKEATGLTPSDFRESGGNP